MLRLASNRKLIGSLFIWSICSLAGCGSSKGNGNESDGGANAGGGASIDISGGSAGKAQGGEGGNDTPQQKCGNGEMELGEACDDKNKTDGDGCAKDCKTVESNFICPEPGSPCVRVQVCGDKKITGNETCDDGNQRAGDGCDTGCHIEPGSTCSFVGILCQAIACGDGIVAGQETCDDGQSPPVSGDGCSNLCQLESPLPAERNSWICPTPGQACVRTTCGNAIVEGSEQCDDGNNDTSDGCSPYCRKEPACPMEGGPCSTACGDGILLPIDKQQGQECDDGNTVSGDGCSKLCKVELGYECSDESVVQESLILPVVLRDFKGKAETNGHPDFENYNAGFETGIVQNLLDAQGKPAHVLSNKKNTENTYTSGLLSSELDFFAMWYRDTIDYNKTDIQSLSFTHLTTGEYEYKNNSFFPLTGLGWGNYGSTNKNFHFTSEVRYWFEYQGGETLQFKGDDDVWVFVNKQLAVDLGGVHSAISGSIVLDASNGSGTVCQNAPLGCTTPIVVNLGLVLGNVYEIVVFQAERHTSLSNYTLTLSSFNRKQSECASKCGDGIASSNEACDLGTAKNTGEYGTCTADCKLPPYCGDGKLDEGHEECDEGVNVSSYGYNRTARCSPECKWTHYCGDKNVDTLYGEQCDDGNEVSGDGCEANCTHRTGCGNDNLEAGEQCDDGNTKSGDGCSEFCTTEAIIQ